MVLPEPGELKIRRNVQDALKKIGGKVVYDDNFNKISTIVVQKDNKETWIEVRSYSNNVSFEYCGKRNHEAGDCCRRKCNGQ